MGSAKRAWDERLDVLRQRLTVLQEESENIQEKIDLIVELQRLKGSDTAEAATTVMASSQEESEPAEVKHRSVKIQAGKKRRTASMQIPATDQPKRGRGRPKKNPEAVASKTGTGSKSVPLPALIQSIAKTIDKPFKLGELVTLVMESNYQSDGNISSMVYQALRKLVRQGKIADKGDRTYQFSQSED